MGKEVAHIVLPGGCFSLQPRRPLTVDVLTAASAASAVLQDECNPVALWLDVEYEALFLTERWHGDVVTQRLPLALDVQRLPQPVQASAEETVVATLAFTDRGSLELFVKLGLHVLPHWLSIRQAALGRNLLVAQGHWIMGYHGQAVRLLCPSADLVGLLRLNLSRPGVELLVAQGQGPIRTEAVNALQLAGKALSKHAHGAQLDREVQQAIQDMQPCLQSLQRLKRRLDASVRCAQGAASMRSWLNGGIIAALVDCAAALPLPSSWQQQGPNQQQPGQSTCSASLAAADVLRSISGCLSLVLMHAEQQADPQAQLLLNCITRCVWGSEAQALNAAQLLGSLLQELTDGDNKLWQPVQQACQDLVLLQQLQQRYTSVAPVRRSALGHAMASGPWSHPVAMTCNNEPDEDSLTDGCVDAASARAAALSGDGAGSPARRPVVPRLSLPTHMPATPQVHLARSTRLSCRASDTASNTSDAADRQPGSAASVVAALQQLGHSCGESVMAADLAAFVTHKQLHASNTKVAQEHGKQDGAANQTAGAPAERQPSGRPELLLQEQLCKLPSTLQLQLQLLLCMHVIVQHLPPSLPLPRSLGCALLEQLLLPLPLLQQEVAHLQQSEQLLGFWTQQRQLLSIPLLARCSLQSSCQHLGAEGSVLNLSGSILLLQFRQRLLDICSSRRLGGSSSTLYEECRDVLLLLRHYLHSAARPHVAEAACVELGRALGQAEHLLRASRVSLWGWPAVQAMDALVQVYVELAKQATTPLAVGHLLHLLGSQHGGSSSSSSSGAATGSTDGTAVALVPADTMQLVLDFLLQRLPAGHVTARSSCAGQQTRSSAEPGGSLHDAAGTSTHGAGSSTPAAAAAAASGRSGAARNADGEAVEGNTIKKHCWQLLTAVLQLASKWHAYRPDATSTPVSLTWSAAGSSPGRTSSMGTELLLQKQQHAPAVAFVTHGSPLCSSMSSSSWGLDNAGGARLSSASCGDPTTFQGQHMYAQPTPGGGLGVQCTFGNAAAGGGSSALAPVSSCTPLNLDAVGLLAGPQRAPQAAVAGAAGSEALRLLVDLLLRQRGGRAYAVAQLDELDGSLAALPLQLEVLNFIVSAFGMPNSYPLTVPQLAEFYVHYHLLHFTRHYYKLPTAPGQTVAACSKGHIKVLLALCRHTGGANLVRRRFLQLKVLDFLIRELSLEHALLAVQQHGQGSSSYATTPASTARSSVTSTLGALAATGKGWAAAAAGGGALQDEAEAADDALTERGVSGLLSSSLSSLSINRETEQGQQNGTGTCAPVAEQGVVEAALDRLRQPGESCSALPGRQIGSQRQESAPPPVAERPAAAGLDKDEDACTLQPPGAKQAAVRSLYASAGDSTDGSNAESFEQLAMPANAGNSQGSPPHLGSVLSRVQKFEAAAAAAQAKAATAVKSPQQSQAGRQPGAGCVVAVNLGVAAAAAGSCKAVHTPQPPSEGGPAVAMGLRARKAASSLAGQGSELSSSGGGGRNSSRLCAGDSAGVDTAEPSSSRACADERQAINGHEDDYEWSEDLGGESNSLLPGSSSPAQHMADRQRVDNSSSEADSSMRRCRGVVGRPVVPRLAFGMPASQAPAAASAATAAVDSDDGSDDADLSGSGECRPGYDLEEDFQRMMDEEEAGVQGNWENSSEYEDSGSECSSLIAAGRDVFTEQEQQAPAARSKPVLPPLRSAAQGVSSSTFSACCNDSMVHGSSDTLSGFDFRSGVQLCGVHCSSGPVATTPAAGLPACAETKTAAQAAVAKAAAGEEEFNSASLCDEACLDDAVGLREEEHGQEHGVQEAHGCGGSAHSARSQVRRALVPHLNLPTSQHSLLDADSSSPASTAQHMTVPSLLAAAAPLTTSRPPAHAAPSSRAAADTHNPHQPAPANSTAAAAAAAAVGLASSTSRTRYDMHRRTRAIYVDRELHMLCLELALHLLSSPSGLLDPLQLPQDPTDNALQHKVLVLLAHLSEPQNTHVAQALADRARSQMQQQQPVAACTADNMLAAAAAPSGSAAANLSGLASCTLRLLKLLSPAMMGDSRLQLGGMIQQGAFSEVHAATLLHAGQSMQVAVKLVAPAENDASCFERIHNEVAILDSLRGHTGIVPLLDYGVMHGSCSGPDASPQQQPQWVLVFPRYSGSLRAWRQQLGAGLQPPDIALYLRVFLRVASTVSALHASNIVHYDIKGDNLLLDTHPCSSGSSSSCLPFDVVLADFGDALMFDAGGSAFAQRHRGTELFSSPEMLLLHAGQQNPGHAQHDRRKHRGVGRAHDIWSLGCTLYELLTGRVLFEQEGVGRVTSYAPSSGSGGAADSSRVNSGSVLNSQERTALAQHPGLIDLVEFMLVGNANWRPGAPEVVCKTQMLLASIEASLM